MKAKFLALAALLVGMAACQTDPNGLELDRNGEAAVTLNVGLPNGATRAAGADSALGAIDNGIDLANEYDIRFILEVYDANGELAKDRMVKVGDATEAAFNFRLVPGRDYKFVVWADFVANDSTAETVQDLHYETTNGLRLVAIKDWTVIDESRDAYTAAVDVEDYSGASQIEPIILTRPFAKLRVVTNDIKEMITLRPEFVTVNYFDTKFYTAFDAFAENPIDQTYTGHELIVDLNEDSYTDENPNKTGEQTLFADYFFAKEGDDVKFSMDVVFNDGSTLPTVMFNTNIPVKRNNLTTVYGPILTDANNVTVKINPVFGGETVVDMLEVEPGVYEINSANGLEYFRNLVNGSDLTRSANTTFDGKTIRLACDIDLNGAEWEPIGNTKANAFQGNFDGQGHTIKNFKVTGEEGVGLFGWCAATSIKNLNIEGATIVGTHYGGALVGWQQSVDSQAHNLSTISNVCVKNVSVTLAVANNDNGDKAGALVGYSVRTTIENCSVENATIKAYRDLGGLVGAAWDGTVLRNNFVKDIVLTIDNSVNYEGYTEDAQHNVGGIYGRGHNTLVVEDNIDIKAAASSEELVSALATNGSAYLTEDVTASTILKVHGGLLDGNDKTLTANGVDPYESFIAVCEGTLKNVTIKGAYRALGTGGSGSYPMTGDAYFSNVVTEGATYGFNISNGNGHKIYVDNCVIGDWNSYAGLSGAEFTNCTFIAQGKYKAAQRIYGAVTFTYENCTFPVDDPYDHAKYHLNGKEGKPTLVFKNCKMSDGTVITKENFTTYFGGSNISYKIINE